MGKQQRFKMLAESVYYLILQATAVYSKMKTVLVEHFHGKFVLPKFLFIKEMFHLVVCF